jgi:hypothetical protein
MTCVKPQIPDNALNRSNFFTAQAPPPKTRESVIYYLLLGLPPINPAGCNSAHAILCR